MSQQELNVILDMMRNFPWGETPTQMRASFNDSARSLPAHPTAIVEEVDVRCFSSTLSGFKVLKGVMQIQLTV